MIEGCKQVYTFIPVTMYDEIKEISVKYRLSVSDIVKESLEILIQNKDRIDFEKIKSDKDGGKKKDRKRVHNRNCDDRDGVPDNCGGYFYGNTD